MADTLDSLVASDWLPTFTRWRAALHNQLALARTSLFVLRRIDAFPFDLFAETDGPFWAVIRSALERSIVLTLYSILLDQGRRSLTLPRLKSELLGHLRDQEAKKRIIQRLRERKVKRSLAQAKQHIREVRNSLFGHLDREVVGGLTDPPQRLSVDDLELLMKDAEALLHALALETFFATIDLSYDPAVTRAGLPIKPDIDHILDGIALRSRELHMPEGAPEAFRYYWQALSESRRLRYLEYRERLHLPYPRIQEFD